MERRKLLKLLATIPVMVALPISCIPPVDPILASIIEMNRVLEKQCVPKPHYVYLPVGTSIYTVKAFQNANIEVVNWVDGELLSVHNED